MKRSTQLLVILSFLAIITACTAAPPTQNPEPTATEAAMGSDAFEINQKLGHGINLGNALEAPSEGEWGVVLEKEYFDLIADLGFDAVRIPIRWSTHAMDEAPYTIDAEFFERVDWAVENALSHDLAVVINFHHYEEIFEDPAEHEERFLAMWAQVAEHYQDSPNELVFEILNEPHANLTSDLWNGLLPKALAVIRENNPDRVVIIGPGEWNNVYQLSNLALPEDDRNIIVTFHYYSPFEFTHQGAEWNEGADAWLGTTWEETDEQKAEINQDFDMAAEWAEQNDRPIFVGEFGAYSKADMESRAHWTNYVARSAEARGFSWSYWEFCSGFGIYNPRPKTWNEPLVEALLPKD
jgi:endoglucanase